MNLMITLAAPVSRNAGQPWRARVRRVVLLGAESTFDHYRASGAAFSGRHGHMRTRLALAAAVAQSLGVACPGAGWTGGAGGDELSLFLVDGRKQYPILLIDSEHIETAYRRWRAKITDAERPHRSGTD